MRLSFAHKQWLTNQGRHLENFLLWLDFFLESTQTSFYGDHFGNALGPFGDYQMTIIGGAYIYPSYGQFSIPAENDCF